MTRWAWKRALRALYGPPHPRSSEPGAKTALSHGDFLFLLHFFLLFFLLRARLSLTATRSPPSTLILVHRPPPPPPPPRQDRQLPIHLPCLPLLNSFGTDSFYHDVLLYPCFRPHPLLPSTVTSHILAPCSPSSRLHRRHTTICSL